MFLRILGFLSSVFLVRFLCIFDVQLRKDLCEQRCKGVWSYNQQVRGSRKKTTRRPVAEGEQGEQDYRDKGEGTKFTSI
jgi:hypothetical protein